MTSPENEQFPRDDLHRRIAEDRPSIRPIPRNTHAEVVSRRRERRRRLAPLLRDEVEVVDNFPPGEEVRFVFVHDHAPVEEHTRYGFGDGIVRELTPFSGAGFLS